MVARFCLLFTSLSLFSNKIFSQNRIPTYAYVWEKPDSNYVNFIPIAWVGLGHASDSGFTIKEIENIKAKTDLMPQGHKVILMWNQRRWICNHPSDFVRDNRGVVQGYTDAKNRFHPYKSIWWDAGVDSAFKINIDFFKKYDSIGGKADVMLMDDEEGFSNWALDSKANELYGGDENIYYLLEYYQSIMSDPRYKGIRRQLSFDEIEKAHWYLRGNEYLEWNALMKEREAAYFSKAIYSPAKSFYPNIKASNYRHYHTNHKFPVPGFHGNKEYLFRNGSQVGTHQSRDFYGYLGEITKSNMPVGASSFKANSFSALIFEVNKIRSMVLSSSTPVHAWVAYSSYKDKNLCYLNKSNYYQEMIFHLLLNGTDALCFFNPIVDADGKAATKEDNNTLSKCLQEYDELNLFKDLKPDVLTDSNLINWEAHFIISSMSNDSISLFRFTPKLKRGSKLEKIIIMDYPATFKVDGYTVSIPNGRIYYPTKPASRAGVWVIRKNLEGE
ncbi:MAG: hypothetical protein NTX03_07200 [Bacteroidetes bacterium]|nr:hypothetical protein [Bacteroidota bacterium]